MDDAFQKLLHGRDIVSFNVKDQKRLASALEVLKYRVMMSDPLPRPDRADLFFA